jgi:hypothetical protein
MQPIHIIKNGKRAQTSMLEVRSDSTLWGQVSKTEKSPMVSKAACERLGLEPKKVLAAKGPEGALLKLGENEGGVLILTSSEYEVWRKTNELSPREQRNLIIEGLGDLYEAYYAWASAEDNYRDAFNKMMEDEHNDGARPPRKPSPELKARYDELVAKHPRAAFYLRAERQESGAHWADNTGKGAAGKKATSLLRGGAPLEEAEAALAERREWVD